ncbi:MAG: ABC transporter permease subunit, partial [Balneolaceae bacterium]
MILTIAKKEMKELFRDGKMKTFLVLLIGLSIFSGWIGFDHYQSVKAEHEQAQQRDRLVWENQGEKNPHSAAHYGIYAFKQMHPLSFVDAGIDHYEGIAIFMEAHVRNHSEFARAQDETALARFGHLSLGFVLLYLLPLFVLLAGFNSFSREKESGTLKMMIGQGVAPWNILLGKWMGLFTPGALFLLLILAAAGVLIAVTGDFSGFHLGSLAMMGLVYLLYLIVFVNITLLVSLLAKNENQALVLLAAIWILAVLIAPNISASIANHTYPYPSSQQYEDQLAIDRRDGFEGYEPWSIASVQLREQTLLEYGVNSVDELPFNYRGFAFQKSEEHEAVLYEYHFNKLREIQENQEDVYRSMAVLSP